MEAKVSREFTLNEASPTAREAKIIESAQLQYHEDGFVEIPDNAEISESSVRNGAYVQAWVWVDFDELDLPFEDEEPDLHDFHVQLRHLSGTEFITNVLAEDIADAIERAAEEAVRKYGSTETDEWEPV
jgi:hypothetical protein